LYNEEINVLYSSPNIVRVTKSRRMRWAGHVTRMGECRGDKENHINRWNTKTAIQLNALYRTAVTQYTSLTHQQPDAHVSKPMKCIVGSIKNVISQKLSTHG
jgi:hypothetical protein